MVAPDERAVLRDALRARTAEIVVAGSGSDHLPFVVRLRTGPPRDGGRVVAADRHGPEVRRRTSLDERGDGRGEIDRLVSHDLRGALRGVSGFLALVDREREALTTEAREFLDTARRGADNADLMAARLVEVLRLDQGVLLVEPVDLATVIADATPTTGVEVVTPSRPAQVLGDPALLSQVLEELVANAGKFGARRVQIDVRIEERWVYLTVADDGPGVPADLREAAFDLFRLLQPKGRHPGVGAGLAVARRIASIHGGRLRIVPSDEGTRVELRLLGAGGPDG
jgi:signal transduction histidine kinase